MLAAAVLFLAFTGTTFITVRADDYDYDYDVNASTTPIKPFPPQPPTAQGLKLKGCLDAFVDAVGLSFIDPTTRLPFSLLMDSDAAEGIASQLTGEQVTTLCAVANDPGIQQAAKKNALAASSGSDTPPAEVPAQDPNQAPELDPDQVHPTGKFHTTAGLSTPFTQDVTKDNLYKPMDAEYSSGGGYDAILNELGYAPDVLSPADGTTRTNGGPLGTYVMSFKLVKAIQFAVETICESLGTDGTWSGVGGTVGVWVSPLGKGCFVATVIISKFEGACSSILDDANFNDGLVDSSEIQASYENIKKVMDNQAIVWDKIDRMEQSVSGKIAGVEQSVSDKIESAEYFLWDKIGIAERSTASILARLSTQIEQATAQIERATAAISRQTEQIISRQCHLENQIAAVQNEANWLRRLLLTPETKRPGYNCSNQISRMQTDPNYPCDFVCEPTVAYYCEQDPEYSESFGKLCF